MDPILAFTLSIPSLVSTPVLVVPLKKFSKFSPCRCLGFSVSVDPNESVSVASLCIASWISLFEASSARSSPFNDIGRDGGGWLEAGDGGNGAFDASPFRRRVIVNWALVGTPLRTVLRSVKIKFLLATNGTHFLSSSNFFQSGNLVFKKSNARQMTGSPKNPKPITNAVPRATISALMKTDAARTGVRIAASLRRGASFGKGAVGERALYHV